MGTRWVEVGDRVFTRRYESWDLNVGLVIGHEHCLVVDTRVSPAEGRELARAVRETTTLPWVVANTHAHLDHVLGNSAFGSAAIWGHCRCAAQLALDGPTQLAMLRKAADGASAAELADAEIVVPDRTFEDEMAIDLGGRTVLLRHLGRGHTDGDVIVEVPDAAVTFAGDLIRESGDLWFADAYPLDWPTTLRRLADTSSAFVVPGHGKVVDRAYVAGQGDLLTALARTARAAYAASRPIEDVVPDLPLGPRSARDAVTRAYWQLAGGTRPAR